MTILTIVQKQCHFHLEGPQTACIKLFFYRAVAFWIEASRNCPGKHYTLMSQMWWTVFLGNSRTSKASTKEHFRICRLHLRIVTHEGEKCSLFCLLVLCGPLDVDFIWFCWRKARDEQNHIDFGVSYPSTAVYICKHTYCERMKDLTLFLVISSQAKRTMQEDQSRLKQRTVV